MIIFCCLNVNLVQGIFQSPEGDKLFYLILLVHEDEFYSNVSRSSQLLDFFESLNQNLSIRGVYVKQTFINILSSRQHNFCNGVPMATCLDF